MDININPVDPGLWWFLAIPIGIAVVLILIAIGFFIWGRPEDRSRMGTRWVGGLLIFIAVFLGVMFTAVTASNVSEEISDDTDARVIQAIEQAGFTDVTWASNDHTILIAGQDGRLVRLYLAPVKADQGWYQVKELVVPNG